MSRSRIEDVLDVLIEIRKLFSNSKGYIHYDKLRFSAIEIVARREFRKGRFKNYDSSQKYIHDACTRRLEKIGKAGNFDRNIRDWLNGEPNKLKEAIEYDVRTSQERKLVTDFFNKVLPNELKVEPTTNDAFLSSDSRNQSEADTAKLNTSDLEYELHNEMLHMYKLAGKETGYWGRYFLRSVRNNGGLETARKIIAKRNNSQNEQKGFQSLIEAGRPDLSLEALILNPKYATLFNEEELKEARRRLENIPNYAKRNSVDPQDNFPGDIYDSDEFIEGAKKRVTINAYERNPKARAACVKRHGYNCKVCNMNFKEEYGDIGMRFIHVHHRKPLAGRKAGYRVDPTKDLVPVCQNCHAMLHTSNPPLGVEELKMLIAKNSQTRTKN